MREPKNGDLVIRHVYQPVPTDIESAPEDAQPKYRSAHFGNIDVLQIPPPFGHEGKPGAHCGVEQR
jgi:hypothetical protein